MLPLKRDSVRHLGQPADRRPIRTEASGCFTPATRSCRKYNIKGAGPSSTHDLTRWRQPIPCPSAHFGMLSLARSAQLWFPPCPSWTGLHASGLLGARRLYLAELDAIAARTRISGIYAINLSYEYGSRRWPAPICWVSRQRCAARSVAHFWVSAERPLWRTALGLARSMMSPGPELPGH